MNNVVSIHSGKFLGRYIADQERQRLPDNAGFLLGLISAWVAPQFFCSFYGIVPVAAFIVIGAAGYGVGVAIHNLSPFEVLPCITGAVPVTPSVTGSPVKEAA